MNKTKIIEWEFKMSRYSENAKKFINNFENDICEIIKKDNKKFELKINEINLLKNEQNALSSSTAIGYCLEEYFSEQLISKYPNKYTKIKNSTQNSSADLLSKIDNIKILINFKVSKLPEDGNNAIAATSKLHNDYVLTDSNIEKLYLVYKFKYKIENKLINIIETESFYIEQIDFNNIKSDNRNWSTTFNANSGRLQTPKKTELINIDNISYQNTFNQIKNLYELNKSK